jgi:hypothetical protein
MFTIVKYENVPNLISNMSTSVFVDRLYAMLVADGNDIVYGEYISKYYKNGIIKIMKSLGIYKVTGRNENKTIFVHPRLKIVIETTVLDSVQIGANIVKLFNGEYDGTPFPIIDLNEFNLLEESKAKKQNGGHLTYLIKNNDNSLYKIGKSKNPFKRLIQLKTEFNQDLILIGIIEEDIESELHFKYRHCNSFGEWFSLTDDDVLDIINETKFKLLHLK